LHNTKNRINEPQNRPIPAVGFSRRQELARAATSPELQTAFDAADRFIHNSATSACPSGW
jgi:hypothetical protein